MAKKPATKKSTAKTRAKSTAKVPATIKAAAGSAIQGISKDAFDKLMKRLKHPQKEMDSLRGDIGGIIAGAVEKDHAHKGALGMVRRLVRVGEKSGVSLGEFLFHFDLMREHAALDTLAAADLFEDRKRKAAEKQEADRQAKADAKAEKANGKDDASAKSDMKSGAVSLADKRAEKEAAKPSASASSAGTADPTPPQARAAPLH